MSIVNSRSSSAGLYGVARYYSVLFFLRFSALANKAIVKRNSFERGSNTLVLSGDEPSGLAQVQADAAGKPAVLRITLEDGQAYDFRREA